MSSPLPTGQASRPSAATAVLTPRAGSTAIERGGRRFSKKLLPRGKVKLPGGTIIDFDDRYFAQLQTAFNDPDAFDGVPLQVAEKHTKDARATEGLLTGLRAEADGLWGDIEFADDDGVKLIRKNPNAGVSVSIVQDLTRWDPAKGDQHWPLALQHVLMTTDPHVIGLGEWKPALNLSSAHARTVIDLSGSTYADVLEDTVTVTTQTVPAPTDGDGNVTLTLPPDQMARLERLLADDATIERLTADPAVQNSLVGEGAPVPDSTPDEGTGDSPEDPDEGNHQTNDAVELMRTELTTTRSQVTELARELAAAQAGVELEQLRNTGIAPAVLNAALPLLTAPRGSGVIELARGDGTSDQIDPGTVIRNVLHEVIELSRRGSLLVDLDSELGETGAPTPAGERRAELLKAWNDEHPA